MNGLKHAGIIFSVTALTGLLSGALAQGAEVRPGTALAKLVAEASSHSEMVVTGAAPPPRIDIPAWLAAHYRRNHSEMPKVAIQLDPTGGYPMALESLYVWMLRHQDLQPSAAPELRARRPSLEQQHRRSGRTAEYPALATIREVNRIFASM